MTKILIADDDATDRTILRSALTHLGYEVEETCDGDQAWRVLQGQRAPELAILDWLMPGLTGPEICRGLRARFGQDPAMGSSVLITACTDSGGFFIFLGLATMFLL